MPKIAIKTIRKFLDHAHPVRWFALNLPVYGRLDLHHLTIKHFPYSLKQSEAQGTEIFGAYRRVLHASLINETSYNKQTVVYTDLLGMTPLKRGKVPMSTSKNIARLR